MHTKTRKYLIASLLIVTLTVVVACAHAAGPRLATTSADRTVHHYLYSFPDGRVVARDIDNHFAVVSSQSFSLPTSHTRGAAASVADHTMYVSYGGTGGSTGNGSMLAYDLLTNTLRWTQHYAHGIDAMAVTDQGTTILMPDGADSGDGNWYI